MHGDDASESEEWRILFQSDRGGEFATWSIRPDGSGLMRVGGVEDFPIGVQLVVSPDGRRLLLAGDRAGLVVLDERGRRRIASAGIDAAWSPDGKQIAFNGLSPGLSVIDADGTDGRRLTRDDRDGLPVWSPDGERIAFERYGVGVVVARRDGTGVRTVWRGEPYALTWSSDGRAVLFAVPGESRATGALVAVDMASGRVTQWARVRLALFSPPAWSPDRRQLAFQEDAAEGRGPFPLMSSVRTAPGDGASAHPGRPRASPRGRPTRRPSFTRRAAAKGGSYGRRAWTNRDGCG